MATELQNAIEEAEAALGPLPTWRERMTAVAADALDEDDAAQLVIGCMARGAAAAELAGGQTVELTGEQVAEIVAEAQNGTGPRAALARRIVLGWGEAADRSEQ